MSENARYKRVSALRQAGALREYATSLGLDIPCDDAIMTAPESPLAQPCQVGTVNVGNRFAIQPMEGWDGTE